jgi:polyisoprenyl-teichoic acid--peptidoglycan teichoic acid transferase
MPPLSPRAALVDGQGEGIVAKGGMAVHGSCAQRSVFVLFGSFFAIMLLGACGQPVFVGLPTPTPDDVVLSPNEGAPLPPFGPFAKLPSAPVPATVGNGLAAAAPALVSVPSGPAFAWQETENYLILGTDRRGTDSSWRTDTIIVVGLDRKLNRAAVLSIPRDLYLEIPNYGFGRINQVDYIGEKLMKVPGGGPALISTVLSQTLGIETDHWMRVEMTGFQEVVNAVGGVTIYLDCPFYEPIFNLTTNSWDYFTLPAGEVHMDGEEAYWYVRLRLKESDIGRSQRQRQFLWAMRDQILNTNLLPRMPQLFAAFSNTFSTDLSLVEIVSLMQFGTMLDSANVRAGGITLRELQSYTTAQGASVLVINDPTRVRAVVDGIWEAPAMVDARRQDANACQPVPQGVPSVATNDPAPTPEVVPALEVPNGEASIPEQDRAGGG